MVSLVIHSVKVKNRSGPLLFVHDAVAVSLFCLVVADSFTWANLSVVVDVM